MKTALPVIVIFLFFSCSQSIESNEKQDVNSQVETNKKDLSEDNTIADFRFHKIIASLPSPMETMHQITQSEISYDKQYLCPVSNVRKHESPTSKALNCGIYVVDLSYLACYHQAEMMMGYMGAAHKLAADIDAAHAFDKVLNARLEKNLDSKDSLMKLMGDGLDAMEEFLRENGRLVTATQILVGSWIESQHIITSSLLATENPSNNLKKHVFASRVHLKNILDLMHEFKDEAGLQAELKKFQKLQESFNKIHSSTEITLEILTELVREIEDIRNDIVEMS